MSASQTPPPGPPYDPWQAAPGGPQPAHPEDKGPGTGAEIRRAALVSLGLVLAGVLMGLLWLWLAPRVPLVSDGKAVYLKDSEGEQAIGTDGVFVLLGLGLGLVSGAVVFLIQRRGGVPLVVGLVVGALLGSVVAWRLGIWLGPTQDVVAHARAVGENKTFDAPLELGAKGVLLAWPLAAVALHLLLTGVFGPREAVPFPQGPWAGGPQWTSTGAPPRPEGGSGPQGGDGTPAPYAPPQQPGGQGQGPQRG
ncbi:ABC transporter permease [Streptomyces sp. NPDC049954]|uniref:ABC transporter permease n=1 Tax=Streptomyces sp. NPDC049954 TaxID=3155779 RepID=UPI00341DDFB2